MVRVKGSGVQCVWRRGGPRFEEPSPISPRFEEPGAKAGILVVAASTLLYFTGM